MHASVTWSAKAWSSMVAGRRVISSMKASELFGLR
jgi:hypothetical protein